MGLFMASSSSRPEPYSADAQQMFIDALDSSGETAWRLNFEEMTLDVAGASVPELFGTDNRTHTMSMGDWRDLLTPDSRPRCEACIADLVASGKGSAELTIRAADGREIVLLDRGRVTQRKPDGSPLIATGLFTDITHQRLLEHRYDEIGDFLESAMQAADLATWRFDLARNMARLDGPLIRHVQIDPDANGEITGALWCSFVHPEDLGEIIRQTAEMADGKRNSVDLTYRLRDSSGHWRWVRSIGRTTRQSPDGKGLVASGILKDEMENLKLKEQLEVSRSYFETVVRKTPAMIHQINAAGEIVNVSDFWLKFMGYERDEVIGKFSYDFMCEESRIYSRTYALPEFFEKGFVRNLSYRFRKKNGETFDALLNAQLSENPVTGEKIGFALISDVTQLRKAYRDLERSNRELDRFATVASHDLQEPLRKIAAFAHLLRERHSATLNEEGTECLDFLLDAASRMQDLIDSLLEYSQMEIHPLRAQPLSLARVIEDVRLRLGDRISQSGAVISLSGDDELKADRFLLGQILQNLISNSIKYRSDRAPEILINLTVSDSHYELSVSDNGIGFDPKFADQVFEPFRRLHPRGAFEGAGIGLAIVRQAVDRQRGRVSVESHPGQGTTFRVTLPRSSGELAAA